MSRRCRTSRACLLVPSGEPFAASLLGRLPVRGRGLWSQGGPRRASRAARAARSVCAWGPAESAASNASRAASSSPQARRASPRPSSSVLMLTMVAVRLTPSQPCPTARESRSVTRAEPVRETDQATSPYSASARISMQHVLPTRNSVWSSRSRSSTRLRPTNVPFVLPRSRRTTRCPWQVTVA